MLISLIVSLLALYVYIPGQGRSVSWLWTAVGVAAGVCVHLLACWAGSRWATRNCKGSGGLAQLRAVRVSCLLKVGMVSVVLLHVFEFDWSGQVSRMFAGLPWLVLLDDLTLLAPLFVMVAGLMLYDRSCELASGKASMGWGQYLRLRFRLELGILLFPWLLLVTVSDCTYALFGGTDYAALIDGMATISLILVVVVLSPLLLRMVWRTSSLAAGPLRSRLEDLCRKQQFRCRDILIWDTDNHLPNACILGPLPWLRYVLLSDVLVQHWTEDEIETIFAHEIGHARHHHIAFYVVFAMAFFCFYVSLVDVLSVSEWVEPLGNLTGLQITTRQSLVMLVFACFYWVFVFGFISRRLEQQADQFSLAATDKPEAFISALRKLGEVSGAADVMGSWRHFSIRHRIRHLQEAQEEPLKALRKARRARLVCMVVIGLFIVAAARLLLMHGLSLNL